MTTELPSPLSGKHVKAALQKVGSIPRSDNEPVFNAPWEAEVFALCLSLHQQRLFTWDEWATELSTTISMAQQAGDPDLGNTYYQHWLSTLEKLVVNKNVGSPQKLAELYQAWDTAAKRTPHGDPITLPCE